MAEAIVNTCRQHFPGVKVILSTWLFDPNGIDEGEWKGLAKRFSVPPGWVDFILADSHGDYPRFPIDNGVPGNLPLLNFPEISMHGMNPWGGFGANPLPSRFQRLWDAAGDHLAGGILYSEGIFEDVNKAIWSQFYWDGRKAALDTVREYVVYEFPGCNVDAIVDAIVSLEQNHRRFSSRRRPWFSRVNARARAALATFEQSNNLLPTHVRASWRWRILFLRATLDSERFNGKRYPNEAARNAFDELVKVYHAEVAESCVRPPNIRKTSRK